MVAVVVVVVGDVGIVMLLYFLPRRQTAGPPTILDKIQFYTYTRCTRTNNNAINPRFLDPLRGTAL